MVGLLVVTITAVLNSGGDRPVVSLTGGGGDVVALVRIDGVLETGLGGTGSILSGGSTGSDAVVSTLSEIARAQSVKAVVLRINSPGGSPAASQEISEALAELRSQGKVIVTSMADMAASGAYWIAANTDHIVADAGTTTGSIGVIWEIPNYEGLYEKLGIKYVTFTSGPHKDMGSSSRQLTEDEQEIMLAMVNDMYDQFVDTVAAGRNLPREKVLSLADGRVFTGSQAKEVGLVDTLGGLKVALDKAAELAGIDGNYQVEEFGRRSAWEVFLGEAASALRGLRLLADGSIIPGEGTGGLTGPGYTLYWPAGLGDGSDQTGTGEGPD